MDLSLEITGKINTLYDALAKFTAIETLDKANRSVKFKSELTIRVKLQLISNLHCLQMEM